jgi:hypothetical protein
MTYEVFENVTQFLHGRPLFHACLQMALDLRREAENHFDGRKDCFNVLRGQNRPRIHRSSERIQEELSTD